ncbi:MAG TPA: hypothetical protein VMZ22_03665 [Acidimicrobiales bacterium]|nr:hypothetical protein [Acidimicrobiales bacterium]
MGVIRKTLSVGTIGAIKFRNEKERLAREQRRNGSFFTREEASKQLEKLKRRSRKVRKADALSRFLASTEDGLETARGSVHEFADEARKRGRKARKATRKAGKKMRKRAEHALSDARAALPG